MQLNEIDRKQQALSVAEILATGNFLQSYLANRTNNVSYTAAYDSVYASAAEAKTVEQMIPSSLRQIFDSVHPAYKHKILQSLDSGIEAYRARNGGEMPRADIVAAALSAGYKALHITKEETHGIYDSATATQLNAGGHESTAVVPTLPMITIATRIANALPLVAYLPNPTGSNEVPLIYVRNIAKNNFGEMKANDYLDGEKSARQYFDSQFEFAATADAENKVFTLSPSVTYLDIDARTPDPAAEVPRLAFMGGRVRVLVNGVEVGNDATADHAKFTGMSTIINVQNHGLVLGGNPVKIATAEANLDTHAVSVSFVNALPAGTEVTVSLIADFERKDANNKPLLTVPSVDISLIGRRIRAYPIRAVYRATIDSITQMQNELGLDARGAVTAVVASKNMLEQNIRLLKSAKRRAIGFNRVKIADLSRGATDTAVFNNTSEMARELLVSIEAAKLSINQATNNAPSGFDIFVSNKLAILFNQLADDTGYVKTGSTIGAPDKITRIGSLPNGVNIYHVPNDSGLLTESANAAEMLICARNSEASRNIFAGFVAVPLVVKESNVMDFEQGVTIYSRQAAELNPIERFADQACVINATNLPVSIAG